MTIERFSQTVEPAAASLETKPPARILVVEDDADIRRLNTELLLNAGYEVDAAEDGAAAWDELQGRPYDLLISVNIMPNISGMGLLEKPSCRPHGDAGHPCDGRPADSRTGPRLRGCKSRRCC